MSDADPLTPPPDDLRDPAQVLTRNIRALREREQLDEGRASFSDKVADRITRFTGSMTFVLIHLGIVVGWIGVNVGLVPGLAAFDPSFIILATSASVEAIFLSTFVLISQNRASAAARREAFLDLQINLLTEHELTRLITVVRSMAERLGVEEARAPELEALERHVAPEKVMERIARHGEGGEQDS